MNQIFIQNVDKASIIKIKTYFVNFIKMHIHLSTQYNFAFQYHFIQHFQYFEIIIELIFNQNEWYILRIILINLIASFYYLYIIILIIQMSDLEDIQKQNKLLKEQIKKLEEDIEQRARNYMLRAHQYTKIIETKSEDTKTNILRNSQLLPTQQSSSQILSKCRSQDGNMTEQKRPEDDEKPITLENYLSFINKNNKTTQLDKVKQFLISQFKHLQQIILKQQSQNYQLKQRNKLLTQKYNELEKKQKEQKMYFQEAILKSEEQNYQFRMEIRKLTSVSKANLHQDTIQSLCSQSLSKKIHSSLSDSEFSDIKIKNFNENTELQNNQEFKKTLSFQIYNILNCIPVQSGNHILLFEPQTEQEIFAALQEIKKFCQRYQENLQAIDKRLSKYEDDVRNLLKEIVEGHKLNKEKVIQDISQYRQLQRVKYFLIKRFSQKNSL